MKEPQWLLALGKIRDKIIEYGAIGVEETRAILEDTEEVAEKRRSTIVAAIGRSLDTLPLLLQYWREGSSSLAEIVVQTLDSDIIGLMLKDEQTWSEFLDIFRRCSSKHQYDLCAKIHRERTKGNENKLDEFSDTCVALVRAKNNPWLWSMIAGYLAVHSRRQKDFEFVMSYVFSGDFEITSRLLVLSLMLRSGNFSPQLHSKEWAELEPFLHGYVQQGSRPSATFDDLIVACAALDTLGWEKKMTVRFSPTCLA